MAIRDLIRRRRPHGELVRAAEEHPFLRLHQEIERLFDDFFRGVSPWHSGFSLTGERFVPSVDVIDDEKEIRVAAELPGMDEKDIEVELSSGALTIRGEKKAERESKSGGYCTVERTFGSFHRSVALPADIEADKAAAEFKNGVLTVTIPKTPEARSERKRIEVKAK